jgi:mono/diheme cytochrome c family protein
MKPWGYCLAAVVVLSACRSRAPIGGDGPSSIRVPSLSYPTDAASIAKGQQIFAAKACGSCHALGTGRLVGPDLRGVTARRNLPWIAKMILKPELMIHVDPLAKKLYARYMAPMGNQRVDPASELPALLAWLKANE